MLFTAVVALTESVCCVCRDKHHIKKKNTRNPLRPQITTERTTFMELLRQAKALRMKTLLQTENLQVYRRQTQKKQQTVVDSRRAGKHSGLPAPSNPSDSTLVQRRAPRRRDGGRGLSPQCELTPGNSDRGRDSTSPWTDVSSQPIARSGQTNTTT